MNIKTLFVGAALAVAAFSANATCEWDVRMSPELAKQFEQRGGLYAPRANEVCEKLRNANARIEIISYSTVLQGKSIAWAGIMIGDKNSSILTTSGASKNTYFNPTPSQDKANELEYYAANDAINDWNVDAAIMFLDQVRGLKGEAKR